MKTLKLSLIGMFLFSTFAFSQNAFSKNIADSSATTLRTELMKMIQNPNLKENGITNVEVEIQFTIGEKGELKIEKINTDNDYLTAFIYEKLDNQRINVKDIRKDKVYFLKVKFELV